MSTSINWKLLEEEEAIKETELNVEHRFDQISPNRTEFQWKKQINFRETSQLMKKVIPFLEKPKTSDVVIKIDNQYFSCHMDVLQSYSKFFLNHSRHEKCIVLDEKKINGETFKKITQWMGSSKVLTRKSLMKMMSAGAYLKIEELIKQCWIIIQQVEWFHEDEAFLLYLDAKEMRIDMVQRLMRQQVKKYFLSVVSTRDFLEMDVDEVENWLKMENLGVNCEVEVFFAATRWLYYKWEERGDHVMTLMRNIRFGLFEPWRLIEYGRNGISGGLEELLKNQELQGILNNNIQYSVYRNSCNGDENCEFFSDFLVRSGNKKILEREIIFDQHWVECFKHSLYMYEDFLNYLNYIKSNINEHVFKISFKSQINRNKIDKKYFSSFTLSELQ